ncbi:MAG: MerR family transcriptional regulator [Candidatus Omnitrophica bacterium]|nr:MerR family transcriptional regulator [Candidatus Omnitrophota bacterium]
MISQGRFYSIGEVSRLTEVPSHILRYWEKHFRSLKPGRDHRGHRLYTSRNIATITKIKNLLYKEGYRLKGVKRHLRQVHQPEKNIQRLIDFLRQLVRELKEIEKC